MGDGKFRGINRVLQSNSLRTLQEKLHDGTFRDFFADWRWIFTFSKRFRWIIVLYTVIGLLGSSMALAASYVSKMMINIIVEKQFDRLWFLITAFIGSTVITLLFNSLASRLSARISVYVHNEIQAQIFDKIIDARWTELNRYPSGDLVNRFTNDVTTISANAIHWLPDLLINIYTFAVTFVILLQMDTTMAFIAILAAPFLLVISRVIMKKMRFYRKRVAELNSDIMAFEVETFFNFDTIKSFGVIGYYSRQLKRWQQRYKKHNLDYNKFEIKSNIMMTLVSTAVSMIAFGYCLYRLWTGQILYGDMTFFLEQRSSLTKRFDKLVSTVPAMMNSAVSAHRVRELVELGKENHDPEALERLQKIAAGGIAVEMRDVSFSYGEEKEVYTGTDFHADPGEIVAIVGASGEGKTTLLRLILGMIDPDEGSVALRGADGERIPINADLRKLFSYVPQGNTVLSGTIADNMRMVREDASDDEIVEALQTACAWEFVKDLPNGINSVLGDNGRGVSMGQAQRISIARALLRDSPILMLDEATSALDADTECRVLQNIICRRPNKTCIVSTHRPTVLSQCQRVYRVENKAITELTDSEKEILEGV